MDEEGEEPFVALDSLLEVNLVEDTTGCSPTLTKEGSVKNYGQESNQLAEDAVNNCVNYSKTTGLYDSRPYSNLDAVQIAWGMDVEEDTFYKDLFKDVSFVQYLRLHCTVCDTHLGCKPGSVLMRHVRLGTLLCKHCFTFYGAGEFPIAEDGSESFCYWCGQGGNVICCSSCSAVFCKKCIKLNYSKSTIKEIESSLEWLCFVCNYRSLWEHRAVCRAAITYESSDHGSLKGDEGNDTPGHNQEFCCGAAVERRIPRLKSSMPSEVTFVEYIKAGRVKVSIMKMLRNASATENASDSVSLDANAAFETEKIIKGDSQNKNLTHSAASKETVSSEQSVPSSHSSKARVDASHNTPYVGIDSLISQPRFPSINSQPTAGLNFLNQGIRPNIINNSRGIPSGRVVVMPPVHIPHHTSVIRFPAVRGAATAQQNPAADGLSLGALLSSSPPVGSVLQKPNPLFPFQNGTSPFVVVSNSNLVSSVPVVVRNSSGAYVPMYVNNNGNLHYIPKESSQISRVPHYVQSQGTNARVSHPNQQQEKSENHTTFTHSSTISSSATHQPNINSHSSQNVPEAKLAYTAKTCANSTTTVKSKTKRGYIQVRSPTALQSVTVSDIEHSPLTVTEPVTHDVSEQQSTHNPLFPSCPSERVPSAPKLLARDHNSLHTESNAKSCTRKKLTTRVSSSTAVSPSTSVLKNALNGMSHTQITSDKVSGSSNPFSSEEISEAHVVDRTTLKLPSRGIDDIKTKWFRENLVEAENVAKYMLTRITCVQEELDSKSHQKQAYDDMVVHFSKFIEIANKKLNDVSRKFTTNFQRWKTISASNQANISQESCVNADKQSSVETNNGQINSAVDVHNYTVSREEVEIISVKVKGKGNRKRTHSGSQTSPPVTCTTETGPQKSPRTTTTQDATSSATCTDSSETVSQVAKPTKITYQPVRMSTRRSRTNRVNTKSPVKCCSSCDSNVPMHNKRVDIQHNVGLSRNNSDRVPEQEKYIHTPEKRRKLKELKIVLERIQTPHKMVFKRELDDSNVINHSINESNAQSLEDVSVVKDQSYLGPDVLVKQLKPCSVVIQRLTQREITHCI